jgi:protein-L-isoaspartate(D-aspartate) O-methyltransferase
LLEESKGGKSMLEQHSRKGEHLRFVQTIEQALGHPLSPQIRQAFLAVSRAHFVPTYYVQEQPGEWREHDTSDVVYQDKALVTKINEKGHPCSSSSLPSIMAAMLEALDISSGSRILEVGSGTGYNAALLAEVVGPSGQVISVDIDDELVALAAARLKAAGYSWVQVATANGLKGYATALPYDRIIVTGGYPGIAPSWLSKLSVGGILVSNLIGSLTTPLVRLVKNADGMVKGTLLTTPAFFMPLHGGSSAPSTKVNFARFEPLPRIEQAHTTLDLVNIFYDLSFGVFLESALPGIERHLRYLGGPPRNVGTCLLWQNTLLTFSPHDSEEGISSVQWIVETRGQVPLWSMVQTSYERWMRQGKPPIDRYALNVSPEGTCRILLPENVGWL